MCLVTYVPLPDGYVLSSNRDEFVVRNAEEIAQEKIKDTTIYYPKDNLGGSWIIASDRRMHVVLLNGAFVNHKRRLPYRLSRGIMLKEFFEYEDVVTFMEEYVLIGIEPFTMVISGDQRLYEFRWDGYVRHVQDLSKDACHVWSSSTLYPIDAAALREKLFRESLERIDATQPDKLIDAHLLYNQEEPIKGLRVRLLKDLMTISHTQIRMTASETTMVHHDLLGRIQHRQGI